MRQFSVKLFPVNEHGHRFPWFRRNAIVTALLVALLPGCSRDPLSTSVPDTQTQEQVKEFSTDGIVSVRLSGIDFGLADPIEVKDRRLIDAFVKGLEQAQTRQAQVSDRGDLIELVSRSGQTRGFPFNAVTPTDDFGPDFRSALDAFSVYRADQIRRRVAQIAPQVRAIDPPSPRGTQPGDIQRSLAALERLDGRAFAFDDPSAQPFELTLLTKTGGTMRIMMEVKMSGPSPSLPTELIPYFEAERAPLAGQVKDVK